ncbi:MAG: endonuclease/exonuclease/phosphatase family protein, partial [Lentisphaerae bacterium]|nr:endonuclease/exonuclease/phosphatase family protein [Lentisphaerota bacterium]
MRILTCNIRYFGARDGENSWNYRRDLCAEVIRSRAPDVICFQEMCTQQFMDLSAALPGYQAYGMTDSPVGRHPKNCIFYLTQMFDLITAGGYWLSATPHVPGS